MSYQTAVAHLYELGHELARTPSHKFDLAQMSVLLAALSNPERRVPAVLVAGTNGKGSTAATLASILHAAGYRTGLYTSPHLVRINERIRVDGEEITDAEFAAIHSHVDGTAERLVASGQLPWHPSFFEILTAMAFRHFAALAVQIAVLEVGMGGRLDATNVAEPLVSVITDISLDHQKFLGNTITEIAIEKAGIIRPKGVVVTLPQHPEANDVIGNTILDRRARAVSAVPYVPPVSPGAASPPACHPERSEGSAFPEEYRRNCYPLDVMGEQITVESPLAGRHQLRNIALAIAAAEELTHHGFKLTPRNIERGIRQTRWPARFQQLTIQHSSGNGKLETRNYLLDVAHNPAGAWALRATLSDRFPDCQLTLLFGVLRDKAVGEITEILFPIAHRIIVTRSENPRSATPDEIRQAASRTAVDIISEPNVPAALQRARSLTDENGLVVITGSIYIVGEAITALDQATGQRLHW